MADRHNFRRHISGKIRPRLTLAGFKMSGGTFSMVDGELKVAIKISRARWNSSSPNPDRFDPYIEIGVEGKGYASIILYRPTTVVFPEFYSPFFRDSIDWKAKHSLMAQFTDRQIGLIDNYLDSRSWLYRDETELLECMLDLDIQMEKVGLPILRDARKLNQECASWHEVENRMRAIRDKLYLQQLPEWSRYPVD